MTSMYYKGAHAILIAFDLSNAESFESLVKWLDDVEENSTIPNALKIIVGLKSDLDSQK